MSIGTNKYGARGERLAAAHYDRAGYELLARNWRCSDGELDLVVRRSDVLVFVEVKARTSTAFGHPAEAVTRTKQQRIRRLARRYCEDTGHRAAVLRFDVVAVVGRDVEVIEAAF